jgi:hypothetical protein
MSKYKQIDWVKFLQSQRYVDSRSVLIYRHAGRIYVELRPVGRQPSGVWCFGPNSHIQQVISPLTFLRVATDD